MLLLGADGVSVTPQVVVAVVTAFLVTTLLPVPRRGDVVTPRVGVAAP
ncbi:hypothetical protein [uncultured Nocardioides sp.]|nr:hypothetical protein [uncultured Nocardioides sp.]